MNQPTSLPHADAVAALAAALAAAQTRALHTPAPASLQRGPWRQHLAQREQAFAVQEAIADLQGWWPASGVAQHWKSGGADRSRPLIHAPLAPSGVLQASSAQLDLSGHPHPHGPLLEAEIALRLGESVSPAQAARLEVASASALIDGMALSLELVGSRWHAPTAAEAADPDTAARDSWLGLSDGLSHAGLVLGPWLPVKPVDWAQQTCRLQVGDQPLIERVGSHTLGDPFWLLPLWLQHLTRHGATVPAGTIVTTGSWTGATPVRAGERVQLSFAQLGELSLQF